MEIKKYLKDRKEEIDSFLKGYIALKKKQKDCPRLLCDAMGYALTAGGKRVRPLLAMAAYEAAGGKSDKIIPVAAAIELIHTYSLVHDDLPAMDDDDFRRKKPTTHKVYGEAMGILAGDALLTEAFNIIAQADTSPGVIVKIINELSYAAGPNGMVGGQVVDVILEGKKAKKSELMYIHTHKTGALIRSSVRIGALMAKATAARLRALTEYGEKAGLAFQVIDDILDITGTIEELGKTPGADTARGKNTYPSIFGMKKSQEAAETLINESVAAIKGLGKKAEPLSEIARYILGRKN